MKTNILKIGATAFAVAICIWSSQAFGQTTTTVTTTKGAFNEYVPGSETMVVKTETGTTPLRYTVTKQTTIVDESGAPVAVERIAPGSPLSIQYTSAGDRMVVSRVVVQRPATAVAPVTTGPAVTERQTTTSTTRELTHKQKHELKEAREHEKKAAKEEAEAQEHKEKADHDE